MKSWLWSGSDFLPCTGVPVSDRGFRYGMSVFESFPVRNGTPIFLREHLARLRAACAQCAFTIEEAALEKCGDLLRGNGDGFARIYVTAGDGSVTASRAGGRVFILLEERAPVAAGVYQCGYDLGIAPEPHSPIFGGLKTANYWANLHAFQLGVGQSKNETLLWNAQGEFLSACMANVFAVLDGRLITPPLASGARAGVIREWVLQRRDAGETALRRADFEWANEIFLTSSWLGIMPVRTMEGRRLSSRRVATELRNLYADALHV